MDFIDDFIEEYKKNPCLWKADSVNFKNRTKRQEAYLKLIDVAAKHGEHYNVERTKQKINNLRCAFRHQLKKYIEFQNKGEKDEPYCPKRRYFESLMFLKDEEIPDRKPKKNATKSENVKINLISEISNSEFPNSKLHQESSTVELSPETIDECKNKFGSKSYQNLNQVVNSTIEKSVPTTLKDIEFEDNSLHVTHEHDHVNQSRESSPSTEKPLYSFEKEQEPQVRFKKRNKNRKRSLSLSSQMSNESQSVTPKMLKDFPSLSLDKVFSLAFKNLQNDDNFSNFGKITAHKLRAMEPTQAIYAEKIIADVLFQGQMKLLSAISINQFLSIDCPNLYGEINSNK